MNTNKKTILKNIFLIIIIFSFLVSMAFVHSPGNQLNKTGRLLIFLFIFVPVLAVEFYFYFDIKKLIRRENEVCDMLYNKKFLSQEWKRHLPVPVCLAHPEYEKFYFKTWEIAHDHVRRIDGMPQNPYMDEGFCDTQIWIWDTCFMAQFCKFAQGAFPGVESFNNFYEVLYGDKKLPKIVPSANEPDWTNFTPNVPNDIYIHIADNPPLFAWGEYENALISGDKEHIKTLLYDKKYLQKHYFWFEGIKNEQHPEGVFVPTCLIAEELGYRWEGGRSGMDNTPRGRTRVREGKERPNNPNMLWIDAICQQALSAHLISKLFEILGDSAGATEWHTKYLDKKEIVNRYYFDEKDGFYYDIDVNTRDFHKVMTVASFWTLTAEIATPEQAALLAKHLDNPETFGGEVPLISLARNDGDYYPDGRYWRGGLWLPTAYAALKGLSKYGYHELTRSTAKRIFEHMLKTYNDFTPHTVWECYNPEKPEPALTAKGDEYARPNFCGWSALGPISMYIEYILGFHTINAFEKTVHWAKPDVDGEVGIKNLHFGNITTDIVATGNTCTVTANAPYTLIINEKPYQITAGENRIEL